ncbi:thioredoxin domain-containing protein [Arcicella sp. LKC2W]|uniref:thioredoxin family protein n=1 Tax=Arcicella sp. LKC2W TaxID=2984198 RepID=UPI002B21B39B|nr:thioredoxin domain-containing protein [Arcicella sp. LKC2W]MEA5459730.1 thioredoxin domain-containing protein [Arcicella sp. LKC2W]
MEKLFTTIFLSFTILSNYAQEINFEKGSWQETVAKAKAQNKPIFIDFFTTWCGPCKELEQKVYSKPEVIQKMNVSFINFKIDAEKGEGPDLARKFDVSAYPFLVWADKNQNVLLTDAGYMPVNEFLKSVDNALNQYREGRLEDYETQYRAGKRDANFLADFINKRHAMVMDNRELVEQYLLAIPTAEQTSEKTLKLLSQNTFTLNGKAIELLQNQAIFKKYGISTLETVSTTIMEYFRNALRTKNLDLLEKLAGLNLKLNPVEAGRQNERYRMEFYKSMNNTPKYLETAQNLADKYLMNISKEELNKQNLAHFQEFMLPYRTGKQDSVKIGKVRFDAMKKLHSRYASINFASDLDGLAEEFYKNVSEKAVLQKAIVWAKRANEIDETPDYWNTYAHLLYKMGIKSEAITAEEKALNLAKTLKGLTFKYEEALAKMKDGKL